MQDLDIFVNEFLIKKKITQGWGWYKYIPKALDVPEAFIINRKTAKKGKK